MFNEDVKIYRIIKKDFLILKKNKIILDRIVIEKDLVKQLITNDGTIEKELIKHYKSFAGKKLNTEEELKGKWINQYRPK